MFVRWRQTDKSHQFSTNGNHNIYIVSIERIP